MVQTRTRASGLYQSASSAAVTPSPQHLVWIRTRASGPYQSASSRTVTRGGYSIAAAFGIDQDQSFWSIPKCWFRDTTSDNTPLLQHLVWTRTRASGPYQSASSSTPLRTILHCCSIWHRPGPQLLVYLSEAATSFLPTFLFSLKPLDRPGPQLLVYSKASKTLLTYRSPDDRFGPLGPNGPGFF